MFLVVVSASCSQMERSDWLLRLFKMAAGATKRGFNEFKMAAGALERNKKRDRTRIRTLDLWVISPKH